jgi:hypothetical protein
MLVSGIPCACTVVVVEGENILCLLVIIFMEDIG